MTPTRHFNSSIFRINTRIGIVEDQREEREFYSGLINRTDDFQCVSQHGCPEDFLNSAAPTDLDIVLMDILFSKQPKGIECVRKLKARSPELVVLMLTQYSDSELLFECLRAGADGYILKSDSPEKFLDALDQARKGGSPMSGSIARLVLGSFRKPPHEPSTLATLTPRELQILECLARGDIYETIGAHLSITVGTVRTHLRQIYKKLRVHSRTAAAAVYARNKRDS